MSDTVKMPSFIEHCKKSVEEMGVLLEKRKILSVRISDGKEYFNKVVSKSDITKGIDLLTKHLRNIEAIDKRIRDLQSETIILLEGKLSNGDIDIVVNDFVDETGKTIKRRTIRVGGWDDKDVDIPIDELWSLRLVSKIFDVSPKSIRFNKLD